MRASAGRLPVSGEEPFLHRQERPYTGHREPGSVGVEGGQMGKGSPRYRVGIEYEGDHHRDPRQFRADIRRYERLQDVGWSFVRVTAADLPEQGGDGASVALTRRIAARLESRGRRTD